MVLAVVLLNLAIGKQERVNMSTFLNAVIQDGPNKGKTIAECITENMIKEDKKCPNIPKNQRPKV